MYDIYMHHNILYYVYCIVTSQQWILQYHHNQLYQRGILYYIQKKIIVKVGSNSRCNILRETHVIKTRFCLYEKKYVVSKYNITSVLDT